VRWSGLSEALTSCQDGGANNTLALSWMHQLLETGKMSTLVLELRPNEVMIVNGAPIRFRTKCRIELTAKVRFLFGKQIMAPNQANTPARRIYFALQSAYIGTPEERRRGLEGARCLISEFKAATTSRLVCQILDEALVAAEDDECYRALKLLRRIIQHEDVVLGTLSKAHIARAAAQPYTSSH
jgi:flagellar protein FlbT